jgi:ATP/maltotriose-dependent transcriptional regulator MalT
VLDAAGRDLRPRDVLRLVADGQTNEEIGERVDLCALTGTSRPEVVS